MAKGEKIKWLIPFIIGAGVGWLLSGTISKTIGPVVGRVGIHPFSYDE